MSSHSTLLRMLGKSGNSGVAHDEPVEHPETHDDAPRLTLAANYEPDMKNVLMNALSGPSKKFTPMDNR